MSMNKNIARLAVTAGLTAALSFGGVMAPVTMAFAEEGAAPSYSLTINQAVNNGSTLFKAYQILKLTLWTESPVRLRPTLSGRVMTQGMRSWTSLLKITPLELPKNRQLLMLPTTFPRSLIPLIP